MASLGRIFRKCEGEADIMPMNEGNGGRPGNFREKSPEYLAMVELRVISSAYCSFPYSRVIIDGGGHDDCPQSRVEDIDEDRLLLLHKFSGKGNNDPIEVIP